MAERLSYRLDRFLHLHPVIQLVCVLLATFVMALLFGVLVHVAGGDDVVGLDDGLWWAVTRMLDGGTVAGERTALRRAFGLGVSLVGLIALAVLTGAFASSFADRVRVIRQGRIPIFERGHIVLLGWNARGAVVLRELAASGLRATVAVLADQDRDLLEERAREALDGLEHQLRVVVKRGDPATTAAVRSVAARAARAVVILPHVEDRPLPAAVEARGASRLAEVHAAPGQDPHVDPGATLRDGQRADRAALRSLLAVRRVVRGRRVPIVIEASCRAGVEMLGLCAGGDDIVTVDARDVYASVLVHAVQQPGAFDVVRRILSLGGSSVHHHPPGDFAGRPFDEAHASAEGGVVVGLLREGRPVLSPDGATRVSPDDRLLVLSDDDVAPRSGGVLPELPRDLALGDAPEIVPPRSLHVLVARYKPELESILGFLGGVRAARVTVLVAPEEVAAARRAIRGAGPAAGGFEVLACDPLDAASVSRAVALDPDVALLLAPDVSPADFADADSDQIITLLHLRRLTRDRPPESPLHAVVELRSPETRRLIALDHDVDFVLSGEIVGMLLAQELHALHERGGPLRGAEYRRLLDAVSASVRLRPLAEYAAGLERPTFGVVAATARARGEVAIGVEQAGGAALLVPDRDARFEIDGTRAVIVRPFGCDEGAAQRDGSPSENAAA